MTIRVNSFEISFSGGILHNLTCSFFVNEPRGGFRPVQKVRINLSNNSDF